MVVPLNFRSQAMTLRTVATWQSRTPSYSVKNLGEGRAHREGLLFCPNFICAGEKVPPLQNHFLKFWPGRLPRPLKCLSRLTTLAGSYFTSGPRANPNRSC